jgi:iron complex transport system substrate-binding protein
VAASLLVAACGDDSDATSSSDATAPSAEAAFPVVVSGENGDVELAAQPEHIVSLSASLTEMLFAIGAGDQVVAVDQYSDYPDDAPVTDLSGFKPNIEAIVGYEPDLVLISGDREGIVASLDAVGVPTLVLSSAMTIEQTYSQIAVLGDATGHSKEADEVATGIARDLDAIVEEVGDVEPQTYFYELSDTLHSATSDTFVGSLLAMLGLTSIADQAPDTAGGYPQLTNEFVLSADPDFVFLADAGAGVDVASASQRPGWSELSAVKGGRIVQIPDDVATRWGPRVVEFLQTVADALVAPAPSGGAG